MGKPAVLIAGAREESEREHTVAWPSLAAASTLPNLYIAPATRVIGHFTPFLAIERMQHAIPAAARAHVPVPCATSGYEHHRFKTMWPHTHKRAHAPPLVTTNWPTYPLDQPSLAHCVSFVRIIMLYLCDRRRVVWITVKRILCTTRRNTRWFSDHVLSRFARSRVIGCLCFDLLSLALFFRLCYVTRRRHTRACRG